MGMTPVAADAVLGEDAHLVISKSLWASLLNLGYSS